MAVAGRGHGNAGGEIQKGIAVHVLDEHAFPSAGDQRIVACIRRGNKLAVERKDLLRFGPWQYRLDVRQSLLHVHSPEMACLARRLRWSMSSGLARAVPTCMRQATSGKLCSKRPAPSGAPVPPCGMSDRHVKVDGH